MRFKFFYMILTVLLLYINAEANNRYISGLWYNSSYNHQIEVRYLNNGLRVKGIHSPCRSTFFKRIGSRMYRDVYGNNIRFLGPEKLIYNNINRKSSLIFYIIKRFSLKNHGYTEKQDYSETDYYLEDHMGSESGDQDNFKNHHDIHKYKNGFGKKGLEGTWKVNNLPQKVIIVMTRDGIKARFSDDRQWFSYKRDTNYLNRYISDEGHQYLLTDDNTLIWINDKSTKKFYLAKISDDFPD